MRNMVPAPHLEVMPGSISTPILGGVPIRVVIAEDNYLVREGIRQLIESLPDLELVGVC